jgi:hypothetical protein
MPTEAAVKSISCMRRERRRSGSASSEDLLNFPPQVGKWHIENMTPRVEDEVHAGRRLRKLVPDGFAQTAANPVAVVRFAEGPGSRKSRTRTIGFRTLVRSPPPVKHGK